MNRLLALCAALLLIVHCASAQPVCTPTVGSGCSPGPCTWSSITWACTMGGTPFAAGVVMRVPSGGSVTIDASDDRSASAFTLDVAGTLTLAGAGTQLELNAASSVTVQSGASVVCGGGANSSTRILVGGYTYRCGGASNMTNLNVSPSLAGPTTLTNTGSTGSLPVQLTAFSVRREPPRLRIEWATASELNNSHFVLLRRSASTTFAPLALVPGGGTTQQPQHYTLADDAPASGDVFYLLEQVDFDGTTTRYGPIVWRAQATAPVLSTNPIRAGEPISVSLSSRVGGPVALELFDMAGRRLAGAQAQAPADAALQLTLPSDALAPGLYVLHVRQAEQQSALRVLVR